MDNLILSASCGSPFIHLIIIWMVQLSVWFWCVAQILILFWFILFYFKLYYIPPPSFNYFFFHFYFSWFIYFFFSRTPLALLLSLQISSSFIHMYALYVDLREISSPVFSRTSFLDILTFIPLFKAWNMMKLLMISNTTSEHCRMPVYQPRKYPISAKSLTRSGRLRGLNQRVSTGNSSDTLTY